MTGYHQTPLHMIPHLVESECWERLQLLIWKTPFIKAHLRRFHSLSAISRDLSASLPKRVQDRRWYLTYGALCLAMEQTQTTLAQPTLIRALAKRDRTLPFLVNLSHAERDPVHEAWLLVLLDDGEDDQTLQDRVRVVLDGYQPGETLKERERDAALLGEMTATWRGNPNWREWFDSLQDPPLHHLFCIALLETLVTQPFAFDRFWHWLGELADYLRIEDVVSLLPKVLLRPSPRPSADWLHALSQSLPQPALFWAGFSIIAENAYEPTTFQIFLKQRKPPLTASLLSLGSDFWLRFTLDEVRRWFCEPAAEPTFRLLQQARKMRTMDEDEFDELLQPICDPLPKARLLLCWFEHHDTPRTRWARRRLTDLNHALFHTPEDFTPQERARWLSLSHRIEGNAWPVVFNWFLAGPAMTMELLSASVRHIDLDQVLHHLCTHSEMIAHVTADTPQAAQERRYEIWYTAVHQLCRLGKPPPSITVPADIDQRDARLYGLAQTLSQTGHDDQAAKFVHEIEDRTLRLAFRIHGDQDLNLVSLFKARHDLSTLDDEHRAALGQVPGVSLLRLRPEFHHKDWPQLKFQVHQARTQATLRRVSPLNQDLFSSPSFEFDTCFDNTEITAALLPAFAEAARDLGLNKGSEAFSNLFTRLFSLERLDEPQSYATWRALCAGLRRAVDCWNGFQTPKSLRRWLVRLTWLPFFDRECAKKHPPPQWWPSYLVPLLAACEPVDLKSRRAILQAAERCLRRMNHPIDILELFHQKTTGIATETQPSANGENLFLRLSYRRPEQALAWLAKPSLLPTPLAARLFLEGWTAHAPEALNRVSHTFLIQGFLQDPPKAHEGHWWFGGLLVYETHQSLATNLLYEALQAGRIEAAQVMLHMHITSWIGRQKELPSPPQNLAQLEHASGVHACLRQASIWTELRSGPKPCPRQSHPLP